MWRDISLNAYDVLDEVHVVMRVFTANGFPGAAPAEVFTCATTFSGKGEEDAREWARDALTAMLEEL
jgi:hypothetical protein